ncbi:MAG: hypothetical protein JOZ31_11245 [Verrucomicrobia bacterium]|nr:hypothetical protein [Verrucomicrobiota bacterium]
MKSTVLASLASEGKISIEDAFPCPCQKLQLDKLVCVVQEKKLTMCTFQPSIYGLNR